MRDDSASKVSLKRLTEGDFRASGHLASAGAESADMKLLVDPNRFMHGKIVAFTHRGVAACDWYYVTVEGQGPAVAYGTYLFLIGPSCGPYCTDMKGMTPKDLKIGLKVRLRTQAGRGAGKFVNFLVGYQISPAPNQ